MSISNVSIKELAKEKLIEEVNYIENLIKVQRENLKVSKCPVYEEVLDTQIYGLAKTIEFVTRLNLIKEPEGKELLIRLEKKLHQQF